ncbi:aminoglycoside 6'-acetyltransferase [Pseudomonas laurylsulfativorans]|uniref:Aminoglycoside N(6')-acetyltransferase type 1 n=1 Tax=Pseudomonas laurylsulfativorans TaxID=1943631 RepID=A0A2S3VJQ7_9PSED|nr:aminoglycoside 6'-N-acetyltransferase [Pseudomonas laurylsulfativorans]POF40192.1 aminoglycoside 6'-acetyltransferase [Pseudomonas laurylsulfativorans]
MFRIQHCQSSEQAGWLPLRQALWPHASEQEHRDEIDQQLREPQRYINFVAYDSREQPVGLVEASLRRDYVNGTDNSPVVYLEGIYVVPQQRRQGVAAQLIEIVAQWGREQGCVQMASDTELDNLASQDTHNALGFEETERVVFFKRQL